MPLTATFQNLFTAVFTPPKFSTQLSAALPLLTEVGTVIQTESGEDIFVAAAGMVTLLTAHRIGLNSYRVSDMLST